MGTLSGYTVLTILCSIAQVFATQNDHEPMVAFVCGKPAMHRGVNGWISDKETKKCWDNKRAILDYCKKMYPNHNITNVVETSYLVTIPGWPSLNGDALHEHRVRPYRCIVDSFQSDALLVPQHCKFDHDHDDQVCEGFSHWEVVARDACAKDGMHCESFGMLLNCGLGTFSGVEYVCCPNMTPTTMHPVTMTAQAPASSDDDDSDDDNDDDHSEEWESKEVDTDTSKVNLYELYLKGEQMPAHLVNEHQRFEAARQYMHKLQEAKNTQLMKEWTAARDHVAEVRKNDPKTASKLSEEIAQRFQRLYSAYEQEDQAEKQQIVALHQQRVQADLNQRKRVAMDKYMRALEKGDVAHITKNLRNYIKAEEKDVVHTVNHYSHVKSSSREEATRIHAHVLQHLKLCQQRMEQALEMLARYPDINREVRPNIDQFMKKFEDVAARIRSVVLPEPSTSNIHSDSEDDDVSNQQQTMDEAPAQGPVLSEEEDTNQVGGEEQQRSDDDSSVREEEEEEDVREDEHDYERHSNMPRPALHQHSNMHVEQNLEGSSASGSIRLGTTFGIAIGSVAIFVVLVVAVVMMRRRSVNAGTNNVTTHGYVEVDPAASPEERHVANMQMNGYENPTYRYFEIQTTK
ncbi:amyloid-beta precursor-like protein isoform X2 [Babylonia areolata]|uniref:amyloid-beta precursor-like protein isoform X2 n=1 Tax=Babylonia areolata TaxID=304850 RepID=UPI003FD2A6BB